MLLQVQTNTNMYITILSFFRIPVEFTGHLQSCRVRPPSFCLSECRWWATAVHLCLRPLTIPPPNHLVWSPGRWRSSTYPLKTSGYLSTRENWASIGPWMLLHPSRQCTIRETRYPSLCTWRCSPRLGGPPTPCTEPNITGPIGRTDAVPKPSTITRLIVPTTR